MCNKQPLDLKIEKKGVIYLYLFL